jgi:hypothetical protein
MDTDDFEVKIIEWKGVRAIARNRKRWKALCNPYKLTGRRGLTK